MNHGRYARAPARRWGAARDGGLDEEGREEDACSVSGGRRTRGFVIKFARDASSSLVLSGTRMSTVHHDMIV